MPEELLRQKLLVSITEQEYDALKRASNILDALYAGGVDNWEWYGDALEGVRE